MASGPGSRRRRSVGLRWGLVGASDIAATSIVPAIRAQPGSSVAAVFSRSATRGTDYAARHGIGRSTVRLDDLLADVDAVYVSSTNDLHREQTLAAAAAGRHVLCEKPLALTRDDAVAMVEACRREGVVLATNHGRRGDPALRAARDLVRTGRLGTPLAARADGAGLLPERLRGWRLSDPAAGAGVVLDLVVHEADTLRFVLADEPVAVHASTAAQGLASGGVEDAAMGVLRMASGLLASFYCSFTTPCGPSGLEVHGTEASMVTRRQPGSAATLVLRRPDGSHDVALPDAPPVGEVTVAAFEAAVRGDGVPTATGEDGLRSLDVALAVAESARDGRVVDLPGY